MLEWEEIDEEWVTGVSRITFSRAKVYGGWLVRMVTTDGPNSTSDSGLTFVPDFMYEWEVKK